MLSATLRCGNRSSSWKMIPTPRRCASSGFAKRTASPRQNRAPESGLTTPAMIFPSVLLPAPFSPTSACTSPSAMVKLTLSSAWVAEKCLLTRWTRNRSDMAGLERQPIVHFLRVLRRYHLSAEHVLLFRLEIGVAKDAIADLHGLVNRQRIIKCRRQNSVHHLLDAAGRTTETIHADEKHLLFAAEVARGKISSDRHGIVVAVHGVDVRLRAQDLEHALAAFRLQPIGHGFVDYFYSGILLEDFVRAAVAVDLAFHPEQAPKLDDVALRLPVFCLEAVNDELARHPSDRTVVAGDVSRIILLADVALQADGRDSGCRRFAHHGCQWGSFVGRDDEQIGLLQDQCFDLRDLFAIVLLANRDGQPDVLLLRTDPGEQFVLRGAIGLGVVALAEGDEV